MFKYFSDVMYIILQGKNNFSAPAVCFSEYGVPRTYNMPSPTGLACHALVLEVSPLYSRGYLKLEYHTGGSRRGQDPPEDACKRELRSSDGVDTLARVVLSNRRC